MNRMQLRHQGLIDYLKLSFNCPGESFVPNERLEAWRLVLLPLEDGRNFVPNHCYDVIRKTPPRAIVWSDIENCKRCGMSFFTVDKAGETYKKNLSKIAKQKLGYTHLARGILTEATGLYDPKDKSTGHINFYDADNCSFESFMIADPL